MKSPIDYSKEGPIHLVGISGLGVSGVAFLLREKKVVVTGSDVKKDSQVIRLLREKGVTIYEGHQASNVEKARIVVASSAIHSTNPEVVRAKELGIPVYFRGKFLAELLREKRVLGVCGSHGKTTTASLCTYLLQKMGYSPGYMLGVHWQEQDWKTASWGGSFIWGDSSLFVCETDESDGSFGLVDATWIIVTNIQDDHINFYGTQEAIEKSFAKFMERTPFYGKCIVNIDDEGVQRLLKIVPQEVSRVLRTFGFSSTADVVIDKFSCDDEGSRFTIAIDKGEEISVFTNLMGKHNVQNITAALIWINELGLDTKKAVQYCSAIPELDRRLKKIGVWNRFDVLDDYAHTPQEIAISIQAVRQRYKTVIACVQPHRYSRIRQFGSSFTKSIEESDYGFIFPVYAAGEPFDPMSTSEELLSSNPGSRKKIMLVEEVTQLCSKIGMLENVTYPAVILFMGAGDVSDFVQKFVEEGK